MTTSTAIQDVPATIRGYLAAHAARDADTAIRAFSPDAVVVDEGRTYRGTDEVLGFLRTAGAQFTFTTELVRAQRIDDGHWVVTNHLEGDFPGGVVDLDHRFTLGGDLIAELVIAPRPTPLPPAASGLRHRPGRSTPPTTERTSTDAR